MKTTKFDNGRFIVEETETEFTKAMAQVSAKQEARAYRAKVLQELVTQIAPDIESINSDKYYSDTSVITDALLSTAFDRGLLSLTIKPLVAQGMSEAQAKEYLAHKIAHDALGSGHTSPEITHFLRSDTTGYREHILKISENVPLFLGLDNVDMTESEREYFSEAVQIATQSESE